MAREYKVVKEMYEPPYIVRVYNEPGMPWRDAKKQLRQWYLDQAHAIRALRENDISNKEIIEAIAEESHESLQNLANV